MTREELESADKIAMAKLQEAHLAWVAGGMVWDVANPTKQARDTADAALKAIRQQIAALPPTEDELLRRAQYSEALAAQAAASKRLAEKDARRPVFAKSQAQLDAEYDAELNRNQD